MLACGRSCWVYFEADRTEWLYDDKKALISFYIIMVWEKISFYIYWISKAQVYEYNMVK